MRVGAGGNTWLKAAPMMEEVFWTRRRGLEDCAK